MIKFQSKTTSLNITLNVSALTLNQGVRGSSPRRSTKNFNICSVSDRGFILRLMKY